MCKKILQIGSGSMGTRRLRDLAASGDVTLALYDERADRRERARARFGIECFATLESALAWRPDVLVISTPPHRHAPYIETALNLGLHFFCEADMWPYDFRVIERVAAKKGIVAAASCSLRFLPLVRELQRVVAEELGVLHTYAMCLSTYAPEWHPTEGSEYYARHRATAPAREMVPFELIALSWIFGAPCAAMGAVRQRGELAMEAEDTYCLQMDLEGGAVGQLSVLMASPQMVRQGYAVGSNGFIEFDLMAGDLRRRLPAIGIDDTRNFGPMAQHLEPLYADEIGTFIGAVRGAAAWPFSFRESSVMAGTLAAAEKSSLSGRRVAVDPTVLPAPLPDGYDDCT